MGRELLAALVMSLSLSLSGGIAQAKVKFNPLNPLQPISVDNRDVKVPGATVTLPDPFSPIPSTPRFRLDENVPGASKLNDIYAKAHLPQTAAEGALAIVDKRVSATAKEVSAQLTTLAFGFLAAILVAPSALVLIALFGASVFALTMVKLLGIFARGVGGLFGLRSART